jgi:hypothetical protein
MPIAKTYAVDLTENSLTRQDYATPTVLHHGSRDTDLPFKMTLGRDNIPRSVRHAASMGCYGPQKNANQLSLLRAVVQHP